jgi:Helicase HerA, central domain/TraM recognition site of TraD and TraG
MDKYDSIKNKVLAVISREFAQEHINKFEDFNFGYVLPIFKENAIIEAMKTWTSCIDDLLDTVQKHGADYADLMQFRGVTFKEYQAIFTGAISEKFYRSFRVYQFIMGTDEHFRQDFILRNDNTFDGFLSHLAQYQVPIHEFFFSKKLPIWFPYQTMLRHTYITGGSGSGKSELLKLMFYEMQRKSQEKRSFGVFLLDPHGDISKDVLNFTMNEDRERIVFLDPQINDLVKLKDRYTFCINPFQIEDLSEENIEAYSDVLVSAFVELVNDATTTITRPMKTILKPCISTILMMKKYTGKNGTLQDLQDFMTARKNEKYIMFGKQSPFKSHSNFFKHDFSDTYFDPAKISILGKIQSLMNSPTFDYLVNGDSTVNLKSCMDSGKIVILRLPQGQSEEVSRAFGILFVALVQGIAKMRGNIEEKYRKDVFFFIDECQNYVTDSIKIILEQARKYGIHLILAQQGAGQGMDTNLKNAVLTNTALKIVGQNAHKTYDIISKETGVSISEIQKLDSLEYSFFIKAQKKDAFIMKAPNFLSKDKKGNYINPHYYLNTEGAKNLIRYFIEKSGYYKPVHTGEKSTESEERQEPSNKPVETIKKPYKPRFGEDEETKI